MFHLSYLAETGFAAPLDILDDARFFDREALLKGLGQSWLIETSYFKPYGCCRWCHAPVDALLSLMARHGIALSEISRIEVGTFGKALTLPNQAAPTSMEAAQFSIPFCLGVAAVHGPKALVPLTDPALLSDQAVLSVASRVSAVLDPALDSLFSAKVPARVTVQCGTDLVSETVDAPLGEPSNPMSWEALTNKHLDLAAASLAPAKANRLLGAMQAMRHGDLGALLAELSRP